MRDAVAARGKRTAGTNVLSVRASPIGLHSFLSGNGYVRNEAGNVVGDMFLTWTAPTHEGMAYIIYTKMKPYLRLEWFYGMLE